LSINNRYHMPKKFFFSIAIVLFCSFLVESGLQARQSDFNYIGFAEIGMTSPTAASLGEYGAVPVSMATGIPSISIPITSITAGDISVPVSLNYHAGGIKVTEYASEVGLGWSLHAGGVITRVVNGYQDELDEFEWNGYFVNSEIINDPQHVYWYTDSTKTTYDYQKYNRFLRDIAKNKIDAEPDVYFYNFGGYSGFFVLDGRGEFVAFPDVNIGVDYDFIDSKGVTTFTITLENGLQYSFGQREYSVREYNGDENPNPLFSGMEPYPYDKSHATAWYLTEISSPQQIQKVRLNYSTISNTNSIVSIGASTLINKLRENTYSGPCTEDSWTINTSQSKSRVEGYVRLNSIYVENGSKEAVNVFYGDTFNFPINYKIDFLTVNNSTGYLKRKFNLSYVNDTGSGGLLLLDSVTEESRDNTELPPYKFYYNLGINQSRESINRDFLGYPRPNRGTSSNHLFGAVIAGDGDTGIGNSRTPNLSYTEAGVLNKIVYPLGGYTEFDYELNEAMVDGVETEIGGLRIKKITSNALDPDSDPIVKTYKYGEGDIAGFASFIERGGNFESTIYKNINGEDCYQETATANPETPLFGHFVQYDYVTELIDGGVGGARTEVYDTIVNGTDGSGYLGAGSDGVYYRRALPKFERIQERADSLNPITQTYPYLTIQETEREYNIYTGSSVGGYFSDIQSLLWRRPDIKLKEIVTAGNTTVDTLYLSDSGLYKRMWAYPTKTTQTLYEYDWYEDTTVWDCITTFDPGGSCVVPNGTPPPDDQAIDSSRYQISATMDWYSEYEYDSVSKQLKKQTDTNSNGKKRITSYQYAHNVNGYTGMIDSTDFLPMLITLPFSVLVEDESGKDLSMSWVTWDTTIISPIGQLNVDYGWKPSELWYWEGNNIFDTSADFNEAILRARINSYDNHGNPIEVEDTFGGKTKYYYGTPGSLFTNTINGYKITSSNYVKGLFLTGIQKVYNGEDSTPCNDDDLCIAGEYNKYGRQIYIEDENASKIGFEYDEFDRLSHVFSPSSIQTKNHYYYSLNGNSGTYNTNDPNSITQFTLGAKAPSANVISYPEFTSFDGDNDVVNLGDVDYMDDPEKFSISLWFKRDVNHFGTNFDTNHGVNNVLLAQSSTHSNDNLEIGTENTNFEIYMDTGTGSILDTKRSFDAGIYSNIWYHMVLTYDGNASETKVFLDGELRKTWTEWHGSLDNSTNSLLSLGLARPDNSNYMHGDFEGSIADVRVYNYALSSSDVADIYGGIETTTYLDGLGRQIQSQVRGGSQANVSGILYNRRGLPEVVSRPIIESGVSGYMNDLFNGTGNFNPGEALPGDSPIEDYYQNLAGNEEDYAYSQTRYEPNQLARVEKTTLPGISHKMGSGKEISTLYGLNNSETFTVNGYTWGVNKLQKTITTDPSGKKNIIYTDGWGQTIASGVDMDGNGRLEDQKTCVDPDPPALPTCDLVTEFEYDVRGNLVWVEDPDSLVTTYTYNQLGQLESKSLPDQNAPTHYRYDDKGRLRFIENANHKEPGNAITITLNNQGSDFTEDIDPTTTGVLSFEVSIATQYDDFDVWIADDAHGDEKLVADVAPADEGWETTASKAMISKPGNYKVFGRVQEAWDSWETSTGTIKFESFKYSYTKYDELDRPVEQGEYYGNTSFSSADVNSSTFPTSDNVKLVEYKYDDANAYGAAQNLKGRLAQVWYYNPNDLSVSGKTYYSYNSLGLVEWVKQQIPGLSLKTINYTYDELGRLTRVHFDPSGDSDDHYFWYEYDDFGRLSTVKSYGSNSEASALIEAQYTYFADGQVEQLVLGEGAQTLDYEYTVQGWLDMINNPSSMGSDVFASDLYYSDNGNISRQRWEQSAIGTSTYNYYYNYDAANRLNTACFGSTNSCSSSGDYDVYFSHDKNGNIEHIDRNGNSTATDDYLNHVYEDNTNRIDYVTVDGVRKEFSSDPLGNVTENQVQKIDNISYEARNLPNWMVANGSALLYMYDAEGNRVKKELVDSSIQYYIRGADGQTLAVYDGSGNLLFINILAGGQIIGQIDN
jgi:YD repeat-containing protein